MGQDGDSHAGLQGPAGFEGFCLRGSSYETTVWELGAMGEQTSSWFAPAGQRLFPMPLHYRVTLVAYGQNCSATVRRDEKSGDTVFEVLWDSNTEPFVGSNPTAPFAKLALHLGKNDVVSGVKAYGFNHPAVQHKLLEELHRKFPELASDKPQMDLIPSSTTTPPSSRHPQQTGRHRPTVPRSRFQDSGKQIQTEIKSIGEKTRSEPTPGGVRPLRITGSATPKKYQGRKATSAGKVPALILRQSPTGTNGAAEGVATPRSRRRPARNGKCPKSGWTAFTAFGMENRERIRAENPGIPAPHIEKMVGNLWGKLDVAQKEEYQLKAQRMKRRAGMMEALPDEAEIIEEDEEAQEPLTHCRPGTDALLAAVDHVSSEGSDGIGAGSPHAIHHDSNSGQGKSSERRGSKRGLDSVSNHRSSFHASKGTESPHDVRAIDGMRSGQFFGIDNSDLPPKKRRTSLSNSGGSAGARDDNAGGRNGAYTFLHSAPAFGHRPREHPARTPPPTMHMGLAGGGVGPRTNRRSPAKPINGRSWGASHDEGNLDLLALCAERQT